MSVPEEDTSPPLTASETAALNTTGQVDKNIPESAMADVTRQYKYFLRKGRPTMSASSKRAEQFLAYAKRVFRSRGMPEDLAYLAIVESGYRSEVRSPAGAAQQAESSDGAVISLAVGQDMATIQRQAILATLQHCGGDKQKAAELLKISERKLWYKLKEYGES